MSSVPRVDFYVLPDSLQPQRFICDLTQKVRRQDLKIYIVAPSKEDALALDNLLWTFRDISFVPHSLVDDETAGEVPVTVGWPGCQPGQGQVLINLANEVPDFASSFDRVVETVAGTSPQRREARERYRHYRELEFEMHSHNIDGAQDHAS